LHKISLGFGITFVIFAAITAIVNYLTDKVIYTTPPPLNYIVLSLTSSMIPYIAFAVVSFIVAFTTMKEVKMADEKETEALSKHEA